MFKDMLKILLIMCIVLVVSMLLDLNTDEELKEKFNNGVLLNCSGLIINNQDWRLLDNNLINNNIAGHLNIEKCFEQNK